MEYNQNHSYLLPRQIKSNLIQEKHKNCRQPGKAANLHSNMLNCRVLTEAACNPLVSRATLAVILMCAPSPVVFTNKFRVSNLAMLMNNVILITIRKIAKASFGKAL